MHKYCVKGGGKVRRQEASFANAGRKVADHILHDIFLACGTRCDVGQFRILEGGLRCQTVFPSVVILAQQSEQDSAFVFIRRHVVSRHQRLCAVDAVLLRERTQQLWVITFFRIRASNNRPTVSSRYGYPSFAGSVWTSCLHLRSQSTRQNASPVVRRNDETRRSTQFAAKFAHSGEMNWTFSLALISDVSDWLEYFTNSRNPFSSCSYVGVAAELDTSFRCCRLRSLRSLV